MTSDETIPFGEGDPVVDLQLGQLIDDAMHEAFVIAKGQRRHQLKHGWIKARDGRGLDEFSLACGRVYGLRDLAAVIAPGVLVERDFSPLEVRARGMRAADEVAGLTIEKAQERPS